MRGVALGRKAWLFAGSDRGGERAAAPVAAPAPAPAATRRPRAAVARRGKAAFTLRLDTDRHLRLRLASAISNRSAQTILIDLLDDYLASLPELDLMASRATAAH